MTNLDLAPRIAFEVAESVAPVAVQPRTRIHAANDMGRRDLLALFAGRPFTTAQAHEVGLGRADLRHDDVTRVYRGVHLASTVPLTHARRCMAALLLAPDGARIAGRDALRLWGAPTPDGERMHLSIPRRNQYRASHVEVGRHSGALATRQLEFDGVMVALTEPAEAVAETAHRAELVDLVAAADWVLGQDVIGARDVWLGQTGEAGRLLKRVADLARPGAESASETRTRLLLTFAGLPEPVLQHEVRLMGRSFRLDMAYPECKIGFEYDGAYHFETQEQMDADAVRSRLFEDDGWLVIHVVAEGIYRDPASTVRVAEQALRLRGVEIRATDGWRRYFPERVPLAVRK